MSSLDPVKTRNERVEAEITQLQHFVESNAARYTPALLAMQWMKDEEIGKYQITLDFFIESLVRVPDSSSPKSTRKHRIRIDIYRGYPADPALGITILNYPLFHPNVAPSGRWEDHQGNLRNLVIKLWNLYTFLTPINGDIRNQQALRWFQKHGMRSTLTSYPPLMLEENNVVSTPPQGFRPKERRSGSEEQVKSVAPFTRISDFRPAVPMSDASVTSSSSEDNHLNLTSTPASQNTGNSSPHNTVPDEVHPLLAQQHTPPSTAQPPVSEPVIVVPPSAVVSSSGSSGFRRKGGIRIYKPLPQEFPQDAWIRGEKQHYVYNRSPWAYNVPGRFGQSKLKVVFLASALSAIFQHASYDLRNERFGILVGGVFSDPRTGEPWVEIVAMLPAERVQANIASVEVSHEEINRLNTKVDSILASTRETVRKIGWYHTHPGHGIFMSGTDQTNQKLCYTADWQVALVVDPVHRTYGAFSGPDCAALTEGLLLLSNTEVEQLNTPAYQTWKQVVDVQGPPSPIIVEPPVERTQEPVLATTTSDASQDATIPDRPPLVTSLPSPTTPSSPAQQRVSRSRWDWIKIFGVAVPPFLMVICGFVVLLGVIVFLLFRLTQSSTSLQQSNAQLVTLSQLAKHAKAEDAQLHESQQKLTTQTTLIQQQQQVLLQQAATLKSVSALAYRKMLRTIVALDPTSDSATQAKQLLSTSVTYTAIVGDTLSQIAQNFNVSLKDLRAANPNLKGDKIVAGESIAVPGEGATS